MGIKMEVRKAMLDFNGNEHSFSAKFAFPEEFAGFQGHFPGKPILPGVCQIEMTLAALERALNRELRLIEVSRGKFLNMALPNETIVVSGTCNKPEDGIISAKFALSKTIDGETVKVSNLSLLVESRE